MEENKENLEEKEQIDEPSFDESESEKSKVGKSDIVKMLSNALKDGTITKEQAQHMRQELGILQGDFTTAKISDTVRKKKRKAAKAARKITRSNGFKGQKMTKGQSSGRGR